MRIDLGIDKKTGQPAWAELIDPEDLPQSVRKKIRGMVPLTLGTDGKAEGRVGLTFMDDMQATVIAAAIESWWQTDVPITVDAVEALPARMYDPLVEATEEHTKIVNFRPGGATSSESATGSNPTDG